MVVKLLFTLTNQVQALIEPGTFALVYVAAMYSNITTTRIKTIGNEQVGEGSDLQLFRNSYQRNHNVLARTLPYMLYICLISFIVYGETTSIIDYPFRESRLL